MPSSFDVSNVECVNLAKPPLPISTGVGYLDHMIDQFNSHAQVGVAISVFCPEAEAATDHNRHASLSQADLQSQVGAALGDQLRTVLRDVPEGATSRFCCPLDEALVQCQITKTSSPGTLITFSLAPYGIYPKPNGRTKIGEMETAHLKLFFQHLAQHACLKIELDKIRGDNGHHIVESTFKALSRALRNLLDGTNVDDTESAAVQHQWGDASDSYIQSILLKRSGKVERETKETSISIELLLDGGAKGVSVSTGIPTLDEFWRLLASNANMSVLIDCSGDLWVDDHHTSEDVAIAVGQVLTKALGTKAGLNRMWCAQGQYGGASC